MIERNLCLFLGKKGQELLWAGEILHDHVQTKLSLAAQKLQRTLSYDRLIVKLLFSSTRKLNDEILQDSAK